jgi:hypothetical protein
MNDVTQQFASCLSPVQLLLKKIWTTQISIISAYTLTITGTECHIVQ